MNHEQNVAARDMKARATLEMEHCVRPRLTDETAERTMIGLFESAALKATYTQNHNWGLSVPSWL